MAKCIKCGQELKWLFDKPEPINRLVGFQCVNIDCEIYNESWTLAEHKDNQDWNVRHTRALEQRVQTLESQIEQMKSDFDALLKKLGV